MGALGAGGLTAQLCAAGAAALRTVELAGGARPANASCFRWDERTRLRSLPNEPDAPFAGPAAAGGDGKCPLVEPNFVNEAGCRLAPACAPPPARAVARVERRLDEAALRAFWEVSGTPVYRTRGQRFEGVYAALTPCTGASRWEPLGGACGAGGRPAATAFANPATIASLVVALLATPDRGVNAAVRDLDLGDVDAAATCPGAGDAAAARGAVVGADGDCWRHVNPHTLNVYHFGLWAEGAHPGGRDVILKFARAGVMELGFPSWHGMERWEANAGGAFLPLLGRWGDAVAFGALPSALQLDGVARWWAPGTAAAADQAGAHVACGSPGKGANDPALGARFMYIEHPAERQGYSAACSTSSYGEYHGPDVAWLAAALAAPDQLRLRVAWALSQLVVAKSTGQLDFLMSEPTLTFHDILVRNALGSFRQLLRKVSYSPLMGDYLTFAGNTPLSCPGATPSANSCGSYPDENYARELMQLFTIGTVLLHEDGTPRRDAAGEPLESYTISDVADLARVWTGVQGRPARSNVERVYITNTIDPMRIEPSQRDAFPKMTLFGGHLGDGYPLCHEAPGGAWLRAGATFRYLGATHPAWHWRAGQAAAARAEPGGALHAALYRSGTAATAACDYPVLARLEALLACSGAECAAEAALMTPRVWHVSNQDGPGAYYEFAPEACVELAFFGEGREAANGGLGAAGELVCADPAQPAGGAVCCAGGGTGAARAACAAPGEYAPFAEAAARCARRGAAPCAAGAPADAAATAAADAAAGAACGYHLRSGRKRLLVWTARACAQRVAVDAQGRVAVRHALGDPARSPVRFRRGDGTTESGGGAGFFRVRWRGGLHPGPTGAAGGAGGAGGCGAGCAPAEPGFCECELRVEHTAPFGAALPQSAREAEEALRIGAPPPGAGHALCASAACNALAAASGALLYTPGGPGGAVNRDAVFAWPVNGTLRHFAKRASDVWVISHARLCQR